jgi:hypothetical protein
MEERVKINEALSLSTSHNANSDKSSYLAQVAVLALILKPGTWIF